MRQLKPTNHAIDHPIQMEPHHSVGVTAPCTTAPYLTNFRSIGLDELGKAALMARVETKYIIHQNMVDQLLTGLRSKYRILEINHRRENHYQTLYFDTINHHCYQRHQAGAQQRWKIRSRRYLESNSTFLEVKYKNNRKRTLKKRIPADLLMDLLQPSSDSFLADNTPYRRDELQPSLEIKYSRITLVNNNNQERVTLDSSLQFANSRSSIDLSGLVVVETKQAQFIRQSTFMKNLRSEGIRPASFSKYCIGTALLNPLIKQNRFKPTLLAINILLEGGMSYEWSH